MLQSFDELTAKDFTEYSLGEKERASWVYPVRVIPRDATSGDDAVHVGVMLQLLIPGVEDAEESDLGAEMPGVRGNLINVSGARAKQQVIDHFFILQGERCQLVGEREDDMSVGHGEQFGAARGQPAVARLALTLRAVPVAAGVIGDGAMPATGALVQMATHRGGAASLDGHKYFQMHPREPARRPVREVVGCGGDDIGQLNEWPLHSLIARSSLQLRDWGKRERVEWTGGRLDVALRQMEIATRRSQIGMAEKQLNGMQVGAVFQQVGSEGMPERMRVDAFAEARPSGRLLHCVEDALLHGHVALLMGAFAGKQICCGPGHG